MIEGRDIEADQVVESCEELAEAGTTWAAVSLPERTLAGQIDAIRSFGATVLPRISGLEPGLVYEP